MKTSRALFAGGCFWGIQFYFDQVPGVTKTTVGYTGGHTANPTYDEVCTMSTGHAEAVLLEYDADRVDYSSVLRHFFRIHDPTQLDRQGPDIGNEYRSAIFYFDDKQKSVAEKVKSDIQSHTKQQIVTEITKAKEFYPAESYHQKFSERTGIGMCRIDYKPIS
jgi:methionine-S-sulfoxide reductase